MNPVRTALAIPTIVGATGFFGTVVTGTSLLTLRRWHRTDLLPKAWARLVLAAGGAEVHVRGLDRFDHRRHFVLVSNHQSLLDVPLIMAHAPQRIRFVAKKELLWVPVLGQAIWAMGNVTIDRAAPGAATGKLGEQRRAIGRTLSLLFFAEGTRSRDGKLMPFRRGAASLALDTGTAILPLAVAGTREVLPSDSMFFEPGPVGIAFGRPIEVAGRGRADRQAVTEELQAAVAALQVEAEEARRSAR